MDSKDSLHVCMCVCVCFFSRPYAVYASPLTLKFNDGSIALTPFFSSSQSSR